jgi:ribosomal protein L1
MNEDVLNMEIRKFLKQVGVTSQREIESAIRDAAESGKLKGRKSVTARVTLTIDALDLRHEVVQDVAFD